MRAQRKDINHRETINEFKRLGWEVLDVSDLKNCFDILVSKLGVMICIEIKNGLFPPSARKLTKGEQEFKDRWQGDYAIVKDLSEVQELERMFGGGVTFP